MLERVSDANVRFGCKVGAGALAFLLFVEVLYPTPSAVLLIGAVLGSLSALVAAGIVLVYRANRIINFAGGDLGAVAGVLGVSLIVSRGWPVLLGFGTGLVAALVLGAFVEIVIIRRFARAPRLILTVATIGIAQLLAFGQLALPSAFGFDTMPFDFPTPFDSSFSWDPVVFRGNHLLALVTVPIVMIGLAGFLRFSRMGLAVRAAAESSDRASLLGIPVRRLNIVVWVLAAGLSAVAALLRVPIVGLSLGTVLGPGLLLRALAAAAVGRMESLPVTFGAAVVLGMVEQAVLWNTGRGIVIDAVLFVIILGAFLLQGRDRSSRFEDQRTSSWSDVEEIRPVPPELRDLPVVRWGTRVVGALVVVALVIGPLFMQASRVNLLGTGVILAMIGVSLLVLTGWVGQVSLGQLAFVGFGAATAGRLAGAGWHFFLCLLAAGLVGVIVAMAIGVPALRLRGPFLPVATFSFALASYSVFLNSEFVDWFVPTGRVTRPTLFGKFDLESDHAYYYVLLIMFGLVVLSLWFFRRTRAGRVLVATRENARAAQSFGVSPLRARLVGFAISGFVAALAGALLVFHQHALGRSYFLPEQSIRVFSMVVFGGLGSIAGVVLGAVYFTGLDYFVTVARFRLLASGAGLLLALLVFPGGLGDLLYRGRDAVLRALARSKRIVVPSLVADVGESPDPATP